MSQPNVTVGIQPRVQFSQKLCRMISKNGTLSKIIQTTSSLFAKVLPSITKYNSNISLVLASSALLHLVLRKIVSLDKFFSLGISLGLCVLLSFSLKLHFFALPLILGPVLNYIAFAVSIVSILYITLQTFHLFKRPASLNPNTQLLGGNEKPLSPQPSVSALNKGKVHAIGATQQKVPFKVELTPDGVLNFVKRVLAQKMQLQTTFKAYTTYKASSFQITSPSKCLDQRKLLRFVEVINQNLDMNITQAVLESIFDKIIELKLNIGTLIANAESQ